MNQIDLSAAKEIQKDYLSKYKGKELDLYKDLDAEGQNADVRLTLSDKLEQLDPSDEDSQKLGIDAFQRQLLVNDISLTGPNSITIEKLAQGQNMVLMPELMLREIDAGMKLSPRYNYPELVASKQQVKGVSYRPVYIPNLTLGSTALRGRSAKTLAERAAAGKGGHFPVTAFRYREKDITIKDYGRVFDVEYKVVRNMPWEKFKIILQLIGAQISVDKIFDIYDMGITGDGTVGAATDTFSGTSGTLAYTDLVTNYLLFNGGFVMNAMLCPQTSMETVLAMAQFQDPLSNWKFQQTGELVTPMGAVMAQVDSVASGSPTGTVIVTIDKRFAIEETEAQPLMVEVDKIIALKFEEAVISEESVFSVLADGAIRRIVWT